MTRPATVRQDKKIIALYLKGIPPKDIPARLNLSSIYVVREAVRRYKRTQEEFRRGINEILQGSTTDNGEFKR